MTLIEDNAYKGIKQEQSWAVVGIAEELREDWKKQMEYDKARRAAEQEERAPPPAKWVDGNGVRDATGKYGAQSSNNTSDASRRWVDIYIYISAD